MGSEQRRGATICVTEDGRTLRHVHIGDIILLPYESGMWMKRHAFNSAECEVCPVAHTLGVATRRSAAVKSLTWVCMEHTAM